MYTQIRKAFSNHRKLFTHDNGGRPFLVYYSNNDAHVYKRNLDRFADSHFSQNDKSNAWQYIEHVVSFPKVTSHFLTGNSIILNIKGTEHIFIGTVIMSFKLPSPIVDFKSPIMGSDVPYPFITLASGGQYVFDDAKLVKLPSDHLSPWPFTLPQRELKKLKTVRTKTIHKRI